MVKIRKFEVCDRCGAEAYVVTAHENGLLSWCGHHYDEFKPHLKGLLVYDRREALVR